MRKSFVKRPEMNHEMVLQITSMADIFTILLVFILKNFSTGVSTISPSANIVLPETQKADPVVDTIKLEVSADSVILDDKPVTNLKQFEFYFEDHDRNGTAKSLNMAFNRQRQKDTTKKYAGMLVLADQGTPFATIKRVLASASQAGFSDYKLVVAEDQ